MEKLTVKELTGYGIGGFGEGMSFALVNTYIMYYCTESLGIAAGYMATMLFFARIFDAFNDPVMGMIAENTNMKWGKHRPWILIGAITNILVLIMLYNPGLALATDPRLYVLLFVVLHDITYTIIDVPYYAYAANFLEASDRDKISTVPRIVGGVGGFAIQSVALVIIAWLSPNHLGQGFFRLSMLIGAVFLVSAVIATASMKNRQIAAQDRKFTLKETFKALGDNDQLVIIITVFVLAQIAPSLCQSVALYFFKYVWHDPNAYAVFMVVAGASMGISLFAYPFIAKKIERRKIFTAALAFAIVGFVVMFVTGVFGGNVFVMLPGVLLALCGFGCVAVLNTVFLVDAVEYGEWKLGYRSENIAFAMLTFLGKFSGAISALIVGAGLQIAGYRSTLEDVMGSFDQATRIIDQPAAVTTALYVMMFAIPPLLVCLALYLYRKKYKLHGDFMAQVTSDLQQKRERVAAEAAV